MNKDEINREEGRRENTEQEGFKARKSRREVDIKKEAEKYRQSVRDNNTSPQKTSHSNKMSKISRTSVAYALEGQPIKIKMALDLLFDEDPRAYIDAIAKLLNYAVPKLSSSEVKTTSDRKIEIKLEDGATLEDIKRQLEEIENDNAQDIDFEEIDE